METCLNGFFAQFARFVISDGLIALLSLLHLGCSSPRWTLHELCQRMLCHSSSDDSSLRAGLCHLGSTGTHDIYGIASSLNYIQSSHFCHHGGSYMDVFSCVRHEMPCRHVYHRVTTYKYGSSDRCCFCCPSPLGNGSLCLVLFSLSRYEYSICLAFSLMSNFPVNPIQSYPTLTFSQSMVSTAPCRTVRVCSTGFCISQLWSYITWLLK